MTDFEPVSNKKKKLTINKCLQSLCNINKYCLVFSYVNSLLDTLEISHGGVSDDLANWFGQRGQGGWNWLLGRRRSSHASEIYLLSTLYVLGIVFTATVKIRRAVIPATCMDAGGILFSKIVKING